MNMCIYIYIYIQTYRYIYDPTWAEKMFGAHCVASTA